MSRAGGAVFAELVRTLGPYLDDVVFVGGWVQALYVLDVEGADARVVRTTDIDLTLAKALDPGDRPPLLDLLREGGFSVAPFADGAGFEISKDTIDVDLLAEGSGDGDPVSIDGQPGLRAFGYPHQAMLRAHTREMIVGPEVHESLSPQRILVPTLPAYVLGKLLSSSLRTNPAKQAKDLVYVSELMAREALAESTIRGLPQMVRDHPDEGASARDHLSVAIDDERLIGEAAGQVVESSGYDLDDATPVQAQIRARLRRLLAEGWPTGGASRLGNS